MSLKSIKNKIKSIDKTRQVTRAMEAVSAAKMRKSQAKALGSRPYALHALSILKKITKSTEKDSHFLMKGKHHHVKNVCLIVVSSDKGLCGSLNSAVFKTTEKYIKNHHLQKENIGIFCVGRKSADYFSKRNFHVLNKYEKWGDQIELENIEPLAESIISLFENKKYDRVEIVYTHFISTLKQAVFTRQVLPMTLEGVTEVVDNIVPRKGLHSELLTKKEHEEASTEYIFEPSAQKILDELLPLILKIQLQHSILEANASEHSARMIAMKNASDNALSLSKKLNLVYNKARQAAITKEVSEIINGIETMKTA